MIIMELTWKDFFAKEFKRLSSNKYFASEKQYNNKEKYDYFVSELALLKEVKNAWQNGIEPTSKVILERFEIRKRGDIPQIPDYLSKKYNKTVVDKPAVDPAVANKEETVQPTESNAEVVQPTEMKEKSITQEVFDDSEDPFFSEKKVSNDTFNIE